MPTLDTKDLNVVLSVLGGFIALYGLIAVKIKQVWLLGEALPALALGVLLGPISARFLVPERWALPAAENQQDEICLGVMRVMIGVQLVIVGYQLPAKFIQCRYKEMIICLFPIMTIMWLSTSACILAIVPKITFLAALVIGACLTPTDPILSQAVAKGPFADKYVARPLREIISAEAGANDGFGSPFLMLAVNLIDGDTVTATFRDWITETLLYLVLLSIVYGLVVGYCARKAIHFTFRRQWIDSESYLLFPSALGLFIVGTCGALGTGDLLACFVAGCALNWDGQFLAETLRRQDEVNSCIDVLLNFGGFMYIGTVMPWDEFHQPDITGITYPRLLALAVLVLFLRRIPALLVTYKSMPSVVANCREALFMGYFGPIGVGAVFYLEHTRFTLFPNPADDTQEQKDLLAALRPVVYFLVLFSIVVHGLSIPTLNLLYSWRAVEPIQDDGVEIMRRGSCVAAPTNAVRLKDHVFIAYNRFERPAWDEAPARPVTGQPSDQWSVKTAPHGRRMQRLHDAYARRFSSAV